MATLAGCGSGVAEQTNEGDAGGVGADVGGAPGCGAPSVLGPASTNADGVLTNYPGLRFARSGGDIRITSAYLELQDLAGFGSVRIWGDLENTGPRQLCAPVADRFAIGEQDVLVVIGGKPYKSSSSTVAEVCLDPGAAAIYRGIQNQVDPTLLATATSVSYAFSGRTPTTVEQPNPYDPALLAAAPKQVQGGWALAGRLRTGSADIYDLTVTAYVRDGNGLVRDDVQALPSDLGDIPAQTTLDFETTATRSCFATFDLFDWFVESGGALEHPAADDP
jgi:hypothetical protein